jgi:hypothetical protein
MNDPYVVALHFKLIVGDDVRYAPRDDVLRFQIGSFACELSGAGLRCEPQTHYGVRADAIRDIKPLVDAWAVEAAISCAFPL